MVLVAYAHLSQENQCIQAETRTCLHLPKIYQTAPSVMSKMKYKFYNTISVFSVGWLHLNWVMHLEKTKSKKKGQLGQISL